MPQDWRPWYARCRFEIEHKADFLKVLDMHEARARNMSDVIGQAKVFVRNYTQVEFGANVWVDEESKLKEIDGSEIFFNCSRMPMSINSVFEGFRQRRFEAIQEEICLSTCRRWCKVSEKLFGEKEMNNLVPSAYKWWSAEDALMSKLSGEIGLNPEEYSVSKTEPSWQSFQ